MRAAQDVAAVEIERRKLDDILTGVPEGVLVTSAERVPIYANRAFRELFEVDPAASTTELLALVRRPQVHDTLGRATTGEVGKPVEISVGSREVSVVARQLEGETGILLMARDVTDANRLTRMRRDFVTNLSHEIKTPLAVIRGAAETLQETGADDAEATEHFVRRIIQQIYRLEDLLKDLLTLARLESPEASLHRQAVDLGAICRRAIELLAPLAAREGVELRSSVEPAPMQGDAKALERMVLNLLVNAIQYNRRGGHVSLRLAPASTAGLGRRRRARSRGRRRRHRRGGAAAHLRALLSGRQGQRARRGRQRPRARHRQARCSVARRRGLGQERARLVDRSFGSCCRRARPSQGRRTPGAAGGETKKAAGAGAGARPGARISGSRVNGCGGGCPWPRACRTDLRIDAAPTFAPGGSARSGDRPAPTNRRSRRRR